MRQPRQRAAWSAGTKARSNPDHATAQVVAAAARRSVRGGRPVACSRATMPGTWALPVAAEATTASGRLLAQSRGLPAHRVGDLANLLEQLLAVVGRGVEQ